MVALWATSVTAVHGGAHPKFWIPMSFAAGSLIPAAFVAFMHAFAPAEGALARRLLRPLLLIWVMAGILFSILSLVTDLVISEPSIAANVISRKQGPHYPFFAFFIVATWATATALFLLESRVARGRSHAELQVVAAGVVVPRIAAIVTNVLFPWLTGRAADGAIGPHFAPAVRGVRGPPPLPR